ncbi:hypothetical protein J6590_011310 [Homalodisca vitripennis]|nr:hypothetical protein J6590_011310 [Homalodisca vitripennis]
MYADDTALVVAHKDFYLAESLISSDYNRTCVTDESRTIPDNFQTRPTQMDSEHRVYSLVNAALRLMLWSHALGVFGSKVIHHQQHQKTKGCR